MTQQRHSWSERYPLDVHHTFYRCWNCGLMRITRHESQNGHAVHWVEWRRNGKRIESKNTPACEPVEAAMMSA